MSLDSDEAAAGACVRGGAALPAGFGLTVRLPAADAGGARRGTELAPAVGLTTEVQPRPADA